MERIDQKDKHGFKLKAEQRKELLIALGRKRDWKTKRAREDFRRPASRGPRWSLGISRTGID